MRGIWIERGLRMIGQTISHYRITAKLGEGGMGVVYRADDLSLGRQVAIKLLPPRLSDLRQARSRLLREAKAASALQHPNICAIFEIGTTDDGQMFMVMPCYEGESLQERLDRGPLPLEEAVEIGRQIGLALAATHAKGIIHRDLKPGNVMLTNDGSQAVLMDFGLARPDEVTKITRTGAAIGTIAYMSPEQLRGEEVDARSDLWSLGVVLYEMVAGQRPFDAAGDAGLFESILHHTPPSVVELQPETPAALAAMIDRLLAKSPAKRVDDATTVTNTLKGAAVLEAPFTWHARQWFRRHRRVIRTTGALAIIGAVIVTWGVWPAAVEFRGIAVLPFEDLSEAGDQEWFCNGMTDAVIQSLGEVGVPGVISRTSTERYRHGDKTISEISRELETDAVVEAGVLQAGDLVRINARLFWGDNEEQIWAKSFERELKNVLQLHSEIARIIAENIRVAISPDAGTDRQVDPEAFRSYLVAKQGLYEGIYAESDTVGWQGVDDKLREALSIDPTFAEAWAALAEWHVRQLHSKNPDVDQEVASARAALRRAFEIEPDLPRAWVTQAHLSWEHEWDQDRAATAFGRALELNPSDAYAWLAQSWWLMARRKFDDAADATLEACRLDPFNEFVHGTGRGPLMAAGRYEEAFELMDSSLEKFPDWNEGDWATRVRASMLIRAGRVEEGLTILESLPLKVAWGARIDRLSELGRIDEARSVFDEARETLPEEIFTPWQLAFTYAMLNEREKFLEQAAEVTGLTADQRISFAVLHGLVGERDRCFELLEDEYEEKNIWLRNINYQEWIYDPLHEDPRFQSLVHRMGLDA